MKLKELKARIKAAWQVFKADYCWYVCFIGEGAKREILERTILEASNQLKDYVCGIVNGCDKELEQSAVARHQMIESVLYDRSIILQSVTDYEEYPSLGKDLPTVIYDCASEEDFHLLLSQDIETSNLSGHGDDTSF